MITRQDIEDLEIERLAPYAMSSRASQGRVYPEDEHPYRTAYQRDRDRLIHTTAFRRLEYKTQVFLTTEGSDYYRTRLTHTIEVAQIGRTIARSLGVNEDLTEAICLAHDLGHGPFGHSGESALDEAMRDHGGFDHNYQSYRIVTELEERFPDFEGLNLTYEVREGIVKHETVYDRSHFSEFDPDRRPTLEAQIVNLADEIAYTTADLDDGLRSGMIVPAQLIGLEFWELVTQELGIKPQPAFSEMDRHRIVRRLVGKEVSDVIKATSARIKDYNVQSVDDIRNLPHNISARSDDVERMDRELKDFLFTNLYRHWRVMRMDLRAQRVITELFEAFTASPIILPTEIQRQTQRKNFYRTICDYIAGMTDRFALQEHHKLFHATPTL
ncbi:MAG TPA: deoxyguanosinetriphosphate triphosphohydrolase [Anaerolineae bacterium]|nr:deoxyguanosinetriphosphate triphosphohydrolase [Anaerolineae bacterium]HMR63315.1 deoxyguanosinetriphosphate triphosphohydrolase [Anaerolineae bacterium]